MGKGKCPVSPDFRRYHFIQWEKASVQYLLILEDTTLSSEQVGKCPVSPDVRRYHFIQ
jgi:hypothetical protein